MIPCTCRRGDSAHFCGASTVETNCSRSGIQMNVPYTISQVSSTQCIRHKAVRFTECWPPRNSWQSVTSVAIRKHKLGTGQTQLDGRLKIAPVICEAARRALPVRRLPKQNLRYPRSAGHTNIYRGTKRYTQSQKTVNAGVPDRIQCFKSTGQSGGS